MRTAMRLAFGLAVGTCAHDAAAQAPAAVSRRLTIHWADPEKQFPYEIDGLVAEARALFAPMGIELLWAASGSVVTRDTVQVVLLSRDRSGGRIGEHAMACVQSGPRAQPATWILVPRVRETLGLPAQPIPNEGPLLSRALARVMGHELIHLIAPQVPHVPGGLMNASLGRDFLIGPLQQALEGGVVQEVRDAFESWPSPAGAWPFPTGA